MALCLAEKRGDASGGRGAAVAVAAAGRREVAVSGLFRDSVTRSQVAERLRLRCSPGERNFLLGFDLAAGAGCDCYGHIDGVCKFLLLVFFILFLGFSILFSESNEPGPLLKKTEAASRPGRAQGWMPVSYFVYFASQFHIHITQHPI